MSKELRDKALRAFQDSLPKKSTSAADALLDEAEKYHHIVVSTIRPVVVANGLKMGRQPLLALAISTYLPLFSRLSKDELENLLAIIYGNRAVNDVEHFQGATPDLLQ